MIDKRYYEKLGGFAYLLGELRKKLGREQTDVLVNDAVTLCNELCGKSGSVWSLTESVCAP